MKVPMQRRAPPEPASDADQPLSVMHNKPSKSTFRRATGNLIDQGGASRYFAVTSFICSPSWPSPRCTQAHASRLVPNFCRDEECAELDL